MLEVAMATMMDPNKTVLVLMEYPNDFVREGGVQHDPVKDGAAT